MAAMRQRLRGGTRMNCPSCGATMRLDVDTWKCDFCHSVYVPGSDDEGVTLLSDGNGDQCPISMEIFSTLTETLRAQQHGATPAPGVDPHDLQRSIQCPHCHRPMEAHFYAGPGNVVLDSCENCELNWLDHGELLRIARAAEYMEDAMRADQ